MVLINGHNKVRVFAFGTHGTKTCFVVDAAEYIAAHQNLAAWWTGERTADDFALVPGHPVHCIDRAVR